MSFRPTPCPDRTGWYEIPGYSGYAANRKGQILNKKTGNVTQGGWVGHYRKVSVYPDGAKKPHMQYTHRLVCTAFRGSPKKGQVVNHLDGDRKNLTPSNLKWISQGDNVQHAYDKGLKASKESFPPSAQW